MATFFEKLETLCAERGITISYLGNIVPGLTINHTSISGWRKGAKPRVGKVKAIADYFGVTVESLTDDSLPIKRDQPEIEKEMMLIFSRLTIAEKIDVINYANSKIKKK